MSLLLTWARKFASTLSFRSSAPSALIIHRLFVRALRVTLSRFPKTSLLSASYRKFSRSTRICSQKTRRKRFAKPVQTSSLISLKYPRLTRQPPTCKTSTLAFCRMDIRRSFVAQPSKTSVLSLPASKTKSRSTPESSTSSLTRLKRPRPRM